MKGTPQRSNKRFYTYLIGVILVVLTGVIGLQLIYNQLKDLNKLVLREVGNEGSLLVRKKLDVLYQDVLTLNKLLIQDEREALDKLIELDSGIHTILVGYALQENGKLRYAKSFSVEEKDFNLSEIAFDEQARFLTIGDHPYVIRHFTVAQKEIYWLIDVLKLNEYFWTDLNGGRSYFTLYLEDGTCLVNHEIAEVGKNHLDEIRKLENVQDTIVLSDFLQLDVLSKLYTIDGYLGPNKLVISTLLITNAEDIEKILRSTVLLGLLFISITIVVLHIQYRDRERLRKVAFDNLNYERERVLMQFEKLREQMNPHFLFNSLGSLQQLIAKDNEVARTFINKLARFYRKILKSNDNGLSTVAVELELAQEYYYLQTIRFGATLQPLEIQIEASAKGKKIPRLSIQTLVENAIKHNESSEEYPLIIHIEQQDQVLRISNAVRKRNHVEEENEGGYGTKFLRAVYQYYGREDFRIEDDGKTFSVYLPLI